MNVSCTTALTNIVFDTPFPNQYKIGTFDWGNWLYIITGFLSSHVDSICIFPPSSIGHEWYMNELTLFLRDEFIGRGKSWHCFLCWALIPWKVRRLEIGRPCQYPPQSSKWHELCYFLCENRDSFSWLRFHGPNIEALLTIQLCSVCELENVIWYTTWEMWYISDNIKTMPILFSILIFSNTYIFIYNRT